MDPVRDREGASWLARSLTPFPQSADVSCFDPQLDVDWAKRVDLAVRLRPPRAGRATSPRHALTPSTVFLSQALAKLLPPKRQNPIPPPETITPVQHVVDEQPPVRAARRHLPSLASDR